MPSVSTGTPLVFSMGFFIGSHDPRCISRSGSVVYFLLPGALTEVVMFLRQGFRKARIAGFTLGFCWMLPVFGADPCQPPEDAFCVSYYDNATLSGDPIWVTEEARIQHLWESGGPSADLPADHFSGRWSGRFFFESGEYAFRLRSDDGVRLWVDGQLVVDAWLPQAATLFQEHLRLSSGYHLIEVAYFELSGSAVLQLDWSPVGAELACDTGDGVFCAQYFANADLSGEPGIRRLEPAIDFAWGEGSPAEDVLGQNFSARWLGRFPFEGGRYTFNATADDGIRLWVDDRLVLDGWRQQAATTYSREMNLAAGNHLIRVEYFDSWGNAQAKVDWQKGRSFNYNSPLGTNISELSYWSTEWTLLDVMKSAGGWFTADDTTWDTGEQAYLDLDEHGWVRSLPAADDGERRYRSVTALMLNDGGGHHPAGRYVVLYEGEGTLSYQFDARLNEALSRPGRHVLDVDRPSNGGILLRISETDPRGNGNYIRNIRVIMPGGICGGDPFETCPEGGPAVADSSRRNFEQIYESQRFHPLFLKELSRFKVIRFMDFLRTNTTGVVRWGDRPRLEDYRWNTEEGAPYELAIELANKLGADPWLNIPARADDEFIASFARFVRQRLDKHLRVYIEYGNEIWNTAFPNGNWVQEQAEARWPGGAESGYTKRINWYGMRSAQVAAIWHSEWGEESYRVQAVMGGFIANPWVSAQALDCPMWAAENGGRSCSEQIQALAIAPYFGGYLGESRHGAELLAWRERPSGALDTLFQELSLGERISGRSTGDSALEQTFSMVAGNAEVAAEKGVDLIAYEGGQHLVGVGSTINNPWISDLFIQANRDPRMHELYLRLLEGWKELGGRLFCHYSSVGRFSKWGSWGSKEYQGQPSAPKFAAQMEFIQNNPCWWKGCVSDSEH